MIKRAYSRNIQRFTQVVENGDGTVTPTVSVNGSSVEFFPSKQDVEVKNFPETQNVKLVEGNVIFEPKEVSINENNNVVRTYDNLLVEQQNENNLTNETLTFSDNLQVVEIYNRSETEGSFEIDGLTITVPPDNLFMGILNTTTKTVSVSNANTFIVSNYKRVVL